MYGNWEDIYTCRIHEAMVFVPFTASMYSILAIALERYLFIKYCFEYSNIVTVKRTMIVIASVWCIALTNALTIAMPWTYPAASGRIFCTCMIVEASSDLYLILYSIFFNIVPILLINVLYVQIINVAKQTSHRNTVRKIKQSSSLYITSTDDKTRNDTMNKIKSITCDVSTKISSIAIISGNRTKTEKENTPKGQKKVSFDHQCRQPEVQIHNSLIKNSWWKKKGIPTLGALILSVTLLWLPLSCGMLVFVSQQHVR